MRKRSRSWKVGLIVLTSGTLPILGDCDPTIQSTVETGLINVSTALLTTLINGFIQAYEDSQTTASTAEALSQILA